MGVQNLEVGRIKCGSRRGRIAARMGLVSNKASTAKTSWLIAISSLIQLVWLLYALSFLYLMSLLLCIYVCIFVLKSLNH